MGWLQDITGESSAKAAKQSAALQSAAAKQAAVDIGLSEQEQLAALQAGQQAQQQTLDPYNQFGQGMMGMANDAFAQQQALMGAGGGDQVMNSPMFQALLAKSQQDIMSNQAARGRMGTGETPMFMQDAALRTGYDVLQGERQAALANTQSLMNPINLGFGAAGQIGQGQYGLGQNQAQTMMNSVIGQTGYNTDAAAATAGGTMGASNAWSEGLGSLGSAFGAGLGLPSGQSVGNAGASMLGGNLGTSWGTFFNPTQNLGNGYGPR